MRWLAVHTTSKLNRDKTEKKASQKCDFIFFDALLLGELDKFH